VHIWRLQSALGPPAEKHGHDVEGMKQESANGYGIIDFKIQRSSEIIETRPLEMERCDDIQGRRMNGAAPIIETLNAKIGASEKPSDGLGDEAEEARSRPAELHQEALVAEQCSQALGQPIAESEECKMEVRKELAELDRRLRGRRKTKLFLPE
jgi:hypothetical protein